MLVLNDDDGTSRSADFEVGFPLLSSAAPEVPRPTTLPLEVSTTELSVVPASRVVNTVPLAVTANGGGGDEIQHAGFVKRNSPLEVDEASLITERARLDPHARLTIKVLAAVPLPVHLDDNASSTP